MARTRTALAAGVSASDPARLSAAADLGEEHSVLEAIQRELTHYAMHVRQIVFLAMHLETENWESLSIPPRTIGKVFPPEVSA